MLTVCVETKCTRNQLMEQSHSSGSEFSHCITVDRWIIYVAKRPTVLTLIFSLNFILFAWYTIKYLFVFQNIYLSTLDSVYIFSYLWTMESTRDRSFVDWELRICVALPEIIFHHSKVDSFVPNPVPGGYGSVDLVESRWRTLEFVHRLSRLWIGTKRYWTNRMAQFRY